MATYQALYDTIGNAVTLDKQIVVALVIKANVIAKLASPTAAQKAFALQALKDPASYLSTVRNYIFADYNTASISAITGATDSQVQTAVNSAVDTLLGV